MSDRKCRVNMTHDVRATCDMRKMYGLLCCNCAYDGYRLCPKSNGVGKEIRGFHDATNVLYDEDGNERKPVRTEETEDDDRM